MNRLIGIAGDFVLISIAAFSPIAALITAFSFNVSMEVILMIVLVCSFMISIISNIYHEKGIRFTLIIILAFFVWRLKSIRAGVKLVIFIITREYSNWLYVPVLFSATDGTSADVMSFLVFVGLLMVFFLAYTISLHRSAFLTAMFTFPIVFPTVVLTHTTPDFRYFITLVAVYLTLFFGAALYPDNYAKRSRGVQYAAFLSVILLSITYFVAPPKAYVRSVTIRDVDRYIRSAAAKLGVLTNKSASGWPFRYLNQWSFDTQRMIVANSGPRGIMDHSLLELQSSKAGTFYLRGFSLDSFDGRDWYSSDDLMDNLSDDLAVFMPGVIVAAEQNHNPESHLILENMYIVKTGDVTGINYYPYFSIYQGSVYSSHILVDEDIRREVLLSSSLFLSTNENPYAISFMDPDESIFDMYDKVKNTGTLQYNLNGYNKQIEESTIYTQIDPSTAQGLRELAFTAGINPDAPRELLANMVASYVSSSATYTLNPYIIPYDVDFTLYFLQTSRRGYCIHFATAAALMLRSLDVPARLASGYLVTIGDEDVGNVVTITDRNAHAWVEVYYENIGWLPLEATPSSGFGGSTGFSYDISIPAYMGGREDEPTLDEFVGQGSQVRDRESRPNIAASQNDDNVAPVELISESGNSKAGVWLLICVVIPLAVFLYRKMLRLYINHRFYDADENAAVLFIWRYLSGLSRDKPPTKLESIALKARFSQHRVSSLERDIMVGEGISYTMELYQKRKKPVQLWLKYIKGVM
ncbi:MAG: hypothetical protein FWG88_07980 [Oscillospiraceae bacterium]|nr:hypothetical protein [Oscillospiraceae bacterium]